MSGFLLAFARRVGLSANASYMVKEIGSFYVGGEERSLSGQPMVEVSTTGGMPVAKRDPNGEFEIGQMYVQYVKLAKPKARYPILLWHGGGLSGTTWENGPDGHSGWLQYFLRAGYDVYVSDAVERGRASWSQYYDGAPLFRPKHEIWELFRFGPEGSYDPSPAKRVAFPGVQFPIDQLDDFAKQIVPRWTTNDARTHKAYDALVKRVGPCVIVVHSQGGNFGYAAAMRHPDKVKALVVLEPSGAPQSGADVAAAAKVPHLVIWGDNIDGSSRWPAQQKTSANWRNVVRAAGGRIDWISLPDRGIRGNTHMMMQDKNSDDVADVVQEWLVQQGVMHLST